MKLLIKMDYVEINPNIRFGKPVIIGTWISIQNVRDWISSEMSVAEIMLDFSELNEEQIKACLNYPVD